MISLKTPLLASVVRYLFLVFALIGLASCDALKPVSTPNGLIIPAQFGNKKDSASIGMLTRRQFFADTNLVKLIDTALVRNFDLQRALQRIQIAKASLLYTRRLFLPMISVGGSAGVEKYGDYTMNGVGNFDSNLSPNLNADQKIPDPTTDFFLGLRSSWEIGVWGKYRNSRKAAFLQFLASDKGRQLVMTSLVADVANLYYELLTLDNELQIIRKNLALQAKAYETIQEMKKGAMANELAVKQFRSQVLNTQGLEIVKQQEIIRTESLLNLLLGRLPQSIPRGRPIREQALPATIQAGVPSQMLLRRPDIQQAELELQATKLNVKVARASFFPSLTLSASTGFNAFKAPLLFTTPASLVYGAVSSLSAPLINRGFIKANYRRSVALQVDAFYGYQKTIATGFQEVVTDLNGIQNYQLVYDLKEDEVANLLEAVDVAQSLFMAGYASYLEVITAQKYVLQAELELMETKREQFKSVIGLYRSLGGGWE